MVLVGLVLLVSFCGCGWAILVRCGEGGSCTSAERVGSHVDGLGWSALVRLNLWSCAGVTQGCGLCGMVLSCSSVVSRLDLR